MPCIEICAAGVRW